MSFFETIRPLMKRGLIPKEAFDTIEREKLKRGGFHLATRCTDAPFYPLPWRRADGVILYPRVGYGYYMRDDVLAAIAWCKKFKIPVGKALILYFLATEAVPTTPKENLTPETLSAMRCHDWVENKIREEKRQEAGVIQFYNTMSCEH